ncbi:MAG: ACP S-malonyltransferase [Defluviitaleaceae bacterium]|nr:ACP S-malonyltransferase [Defluviitaleaceae bacterium]
MRAFIFSGQGSQYAGMGKDLYDAFPEAKAAFGEADEVLGLPLSEIIFNDAEALNLTENTQPAILAMSAAIARILSINGVTAGFTGGLSLGEVTAYVFSGAMSYADGLRLTKARGRFMSETVPAGAGGMLAVMNAPPDAITDIVEKAGQSGYIAVANYNSPAQTVLSGEAAAIEAARALVAAAGGRAVKLNTAWAFHSKMMERASELFREELERVRFTPGKLDIPVVSNITGGFIRDAGEIPALMVAQIKSPVRWEACVRTLIAAGADEFVEIGPGKALTGFVRQIDKSVKAVNVENVKTLEAFLTASRKNIRNTAVGAASGRPILG